MKKTLSIILAVIMLIGIVPITSYAGDNPVPEELKVTNAVGGFCDTTVELSWTKNITTIPTGYNLYFSRSYDGENFELVDTKFNSVNTTTTYTYKCVDADYGKTIYLGVQYGLSDSKREALATVSVKIKAKSTEPGDPNVPEGETPEDYYANLLLAGLADPTYKKTTANYDGYRIVTGTKAVWDCKLYTLTATATGVSGSIVTFNMTFNSKIPEKYTKVNGGWNGYHIKAVTNTDSKEFSPDQKMQFTVDTSKVDPFDTSCAAGGTQFVNIRVTKNEKDAFPIYSSNPYFAGIQSKRDVYPKNSGSITEVNLEDNYYLSYYVKPDYKINANAISVSKNSIYLGNYGYESIIKYRAKGASNWNEKSFDKNTGINITGLKAGTTYEFQALCKVYYKNLETGQYKYDVDTAGGSFSLTTVINQKPKVTSVKVSKIKYGKKTIPAHWEYHSGSSPTWRKTQKLKTATYTITVKVKNVPKAAKGLRLKLGGAEYYAKGNKKTYKFKVTSYNAKKVKGIKVKGYFAWSSNNSGNYPFGVGPNKKTTYKIKKGTYKIK
ncbi:MAG: hypothetical protein IKF64_01795 [Eubacterium sp.]|nr:hypothetical protein [Eubacterium sp.]